MGMLPSGVSSTVKAQMHLTAHISELQILIQNLSAEFSKINSNFQVLKSNEVKTVDEIIRNDQQVKISYAECVSKNSQKTIIVRP
jgi:hypothetical protein